MSSCTWPKIWAFDCCQPSTPAVAYLIPGWDEQSPKMQFHWNFVLWRCVSCDWRTICFSSRTWPHIFIFCSNALLAAVTMFECTRCHGWLVSIQSLLYTKNRSCNAFFSRSTGELETRCLGAWDEDRHWNRHLHCVCRDHHPGVCCLKSLHWGSCVWGIQFSTDNFCLWLHWHVVIYSYMNNVLSCCW